VPLLLLPRRFFRSIPCYCCFLSSSRQRKSRQDGADEIPEDAEMGMGEIEAAGELTTTRIDTVGELPAPRIETAGELPKGA
jgi:hypothetical protein